MKHKHNFPLLLIAGLLLAGCTTSSVMFDYTPEPLKLADGASGQALVLGQAYMRGYGDWSQLIISSVDEVQTFSQLQLRPRINFLMPAGKRTIRVKVQLGNHMKWQGTENDPQVTAELEAGAAYQLLAREATNIRGETGVELSLERIGTIAEYETFLKLHPGHRLGQPLTRADLGST